MQFTTAKIKEEDVAAIVELSSYSCDDEEEEEEDEDAYYRNVVAFL